MDANYIQHVRSLLQYFAGKGFEITKANYGGYERPSHVEQYRPDVVAWESEKELFHMGNIVDKNDLQNTKTHSQFFTLSNLMMEEGRSQGKKIPYYVGIPIEQKEYLQPKIQQLNQFRNNILTVEV